MKAQVRTFQCAWSGTNPTFCQRFISQTIAINKAREDAQEALARHGPPPAASVDEVEAELTTLAMAERM